MSVSDQSVLAVIENPPSLQTLPETSLIDLLTSGSKEMDGLSDGREGGRQNKGCGGESDENVREIRRATRG